MKSKIVLTGGGTGGHVFPALALAEEFQNRGHEVLYIGSNRGMEARLAPARKVRFLTVKTGPVKNQKITRIVKTLFQLVGATFWALGTLRKEKPAAVVGVGGYVSVPVCFAAFLLRIPVFLQEQNVSVGIANRFLGKISRRVFLGFPEAEKYFPPGRTVASGNPIRKEFFEPFPPFESQGKRLLVLGGSQGARAINEVLSKHKDRLPKDLEILHQTGTSDVESVRAAYQGYPGKVEVTPFIENIREAMARATVVVSRSGALTVSELAQASRPSLLVPFPRQGQNDQTDNARWLERHGAAVVVEQGEGFADRFWAAWKAVYQPERLAEMHRGFSALRRPPALATICDRIEKDLG